MDIRRYSRQTIIRLIISGIVLIFLVGGGLILLFYGPGALSLGVLCMIAGLSPVLLIILFLWVIEWISKHER